MKKHLSFFGLVLALAAIAVSVGAYSNPGTFPADTPVVPVTNGEANQVKTGGLSVKAFTTRNASTFKDIVFIKGIVRGGVLGTTGPSTVNFGDTGVPAVTVEVQGDIQTDSTISADDLRGSGQRKTCTVGDDRIVICP